MTEEQRKKLSKVIDLNWDLSHETNPLKKFEMAMELSRLKKDLRDDMGHNEYDTFMDNGRKMFAPKTSEE
jgi:hypothetical protein